MNAALVELRDDFAGRAMQSFLCCPREERPDDDDTLAKWAYSAADAMLRARNPPPPDTRLISPAGTPIVKDRTGSATADGKGGVEFSLADDDHNRRTIADEMDGKHEPGIDPPGETAVAVATDFQKELAALSAELDEKLIPAVRHLAWAQVRVTHGKNEGKFLGELDDDSMSGYEKVFCPPYLDDAVGLWRAWKDECNKQAKPLPASKKRMRDKTDPPREVPLTGPNTPIDPTRIVDGGRVVSTDEFANVAIHFGKNKGRTIDDLNPQEVHWYESDWMPKKEVNGPTSAEDVLLIDALKLYRAWRQGTPRPPAFPGGASAKPVTETQKKQAELRARTDLPKRPAKPSKDAYAVDTVPAPQKAVETNPGAPVVAWRDFVLPIGKSVAEGGSRGLKLGDLPLSELREIKDRWLDKQPWNEPAKLPPFAVELKACVEAGIVNDGREEPMAIENLPSNPLGDLFRRLDDFKISPDEFLLKMQAVEKLGPLFVSLAQISEDEAAAFLADWDNTVREFDED